MKNVVIFQDWIEKNTYGHGWTQDELFAYFKARIDNSINLGWDVNDIIVCTNLDFSYKDVQIIQLYDICQYNKYFNKQYGIAELLRRELITEPFWFHDFDDWQLAPFTFPEFDGDIGMCKYIDFTQWNTGSIFVKPTSLDIWELIVEFMKINSSNPGLEQIGDENIVNYIYNQYPEIRSRVSLLDSRYNVGCTQFDMRYIDATKPILVGAFKPGTPGQDLFASKQMLTNDLENTFKLHIFK